MNDSESHYMSTSFNLDNNDEQEQINNIKYDEEYNKDDTTDNEDWENDDYSEVQIEEDKGRHKIYKTVNLNPTVYTIGQVAEILNVEVSTVRHWSNKFEDYLQIHKSGKNRMYTQNNIKQLKYIKYLLKEQGLPIKHVIDFLNSEEGQLITPTDNEKDNIIMEMMSKVLMSGLNETMVQYFAQMSYSFKEELNKTNAKIEELQIALKESVENSTQKQTEVITETINKATTQFTNEIQAHIKTMSGEEVDYLKQDQEKMAYLREKLSKTETSLNKIEQYIDTSQTQQKKKGLFSFLKR